MRVGLLRCISPQLAHCRPERVARHVCNWRKLTPHLQPNLTGKQINAGQQTDGAVALIFMIAREGRLHAGSGGRSGAVFAIAWIPGFSS
jgi:hypothetical protein